MPCAFITSAGLRGAMSPFSQHSRCSLRSVARIHDVGGMDGFGPVDPADDGQPFHADWEARVYAMSVALLQKGVYTLDEFRDRVERLDPVTYLSSSYYERFFAALQELVAEKGV